MERLVPPGEAMAILESYSFEWNGRDDEGKCSLLAERLTDVDNQMQIRVWQPEGVPLKRFHEDVLTIPEDKPTTMLLRLSWDSDDRAPPVGAMVWLFKMDVRTDDQGEFLGFTKQSRWAPKTNGSAHDHISVVEMFAGGFAGWKMAWTTLQPRIPKDIKTLAIDNDVKACQTYAITHDASYLPRQTNIDETVFDRFANHAIWHQDIEDNEVQMAITKIAPEVVSISAPCPPWSGAAGSEGLFRQEGQLLMKALLLCRTARPKIIAVEQVAKFHAHKHKAMIMQTIRFMGYRLCWQKVLDMSHHSQTNRSRWLAILVRVTETVPLPLKHWPATKQTIPQSVLKLSAHDLHRLIVDDSVISIASNPQMKHGAQHMTPQQVFNSRITKPQDTAPCFMAQYGNQHRLPERLLTESGYFGHFLMDNLNEEELIRFWHPAEAALIHGIMNKYWVDADFPTAWKIVGNCIGTPHALYVLSNVLEYFGMSVSMEELFDEYHTRKMTAQQCALVDTPQGQMLLPRNADLADETKANIQQLYENVDNAVNQWWHPQRGWQGCEQVQSPNPTVPEATSEITPCTEPMFGCYEGFLCFGQKSQQFWFSMSLQATEIETHWNGAFCANQREMKPGSRFVPQPYGPDPWMLPNQSIMVFTPMDASIIKIDGSIPYGNQPQMQEFGKVYDQFGDVMDYQKPRTHDVLTTLPWQSTPAKCKLVPLSFAIMRSQTIWKWDHVEDEIVATVQGPSEHTQVVCQFWSQLLTHNTLTMLGRTVRVEANKVIFAPVPEKIACPHMPFRMGIAAQAAKTLLSLCHFENTRHTYPVKIRLYGRPLWAGQLPANVTMDVVKTILEMSMEPAQHGRGYRVIVQGRQIYESTIEELFLEGHHKLTLNIVGSQRGGGGEGHKGAKIQQRQLMQSSIATILLEQGYGLEWTKSTVDQLIWKYSLARLQTICAMDRGPQKLQAVLELCKEQGIQQPVANKPVNQTNTRGVPWTSNKKKRDGFHNIDPRDYQIVEGFFTNSDDSPAEVIHSIKPQTSGLYLLTAGQAQQWINSDQLLSSDELVILALGQVQPHRNLVTKQITFPAVNPNQDRVLLHGTMVQLGAKQMKHRQGDPNQITEEKCTVLSVTLCKGDWQESEWQSITHNPVPFIRNILAQDNMASHLQSVWGKSLRNGKAPASPQQALSCQLHCTVMDQHLKQLMAKSGYNGLFFIPKTKSGKVQQEYKIIWCEGDLPQVTGLGSKTPHALGLVRNRAGKGYGLRVEKSKFQEAWKQVYPGTTPPELREGERSFKVENMMFGTTKTMVDQWLNTIGWKAVAHRSLGPQCWIIKSDQNPPEGIHMFNTSPVLIRELQERSQKQERVILGPVHRQQGDPWQSQPSTDPWAGWQPTQPAAQHSQPAVSVPSVRQAAGPIETKFQEQETRIQELQTNLKQLQKTQSENHQTLASQVVQIEKQQQAQGVQMHSALKQLQSDMDKTFSLTLQQHAKAVDGKFDELKRLLTTKPKRGQPEDGDEDMESR
eukprot:Skav227741  [mRNA]  locus=scaffold3513:164136:168659:+ [translate_table: standard]